MTAVHGRFTQITVATQNISPWCRNSSYKISPDIHDNTGYGATAKRKTGGLIDNTFTASGIYDDTALTGPGTALRPIVGTTVTVTRMIQGVGTGKPLDTFSAVVGDYVETSPHDDLVTWSCDFAIDGTVTRTTQV